MPKVVRSTILRVALPAIAFSSCGSDDLSRMEAAEGTREVLCSFPNVECDEAFLPEDSLRVLADSLTIRHDAEDVRHIDVRKTHLVTFYRTDEGWEPRMSEDLKQRAEEYLKEKEAARSLVRAELSKIDTAQMFYKIRNGRYAASRHQLDYNESYSVRAQILAAETDWWLAKAEKYPVECIRFEGNLPQRFDSLVGAFDADDILGGCLP